MVHAEGRDFRSRYRLIVRIECAHATATAAYLDGDLNLYGSEGGGLMGYVCKGPDEQPWAAFNEGNSYYVGGGAIRGPFVKKWNGATWDFVSWGGTTDGGVGIQQPTAGDANIPQDYTVYNPAELPGGPWRGQWGYGGSAGDSGSYATGGVTGTPTKDSPHNPWICCDGSNIYVVFHWIRQVWTPDGVGGPPGILSDFFSSWRVRMYDGANWTELGTPPNSHLNYGDNSDSATAIGSYAVVMRANSTGVYLWYVDGDRADTSTFKSYVTTWTGAAWSDLDSSIAALDGIESPVGDMQVDDSGRPSVAWVDGAFAYVSTYRGGAWNTETLDLPTFYPDDIPTGLTFVTNSISMSPTLNARGRFLIGVQASRDSFETYLIEYDPADGAFYDYYAGAVLTSGHTANPNTRVVSAQVLQQTPADIVYLMVVIAHGLGGTPTYTQEVLTWIPCNERWFKVGDQLSGVSGSGSVGYMNGSDIYGLTISSETAGPVDYFRVWKASVTPGTPAPNLVAISPPTNDDFANATTIAGGVGTTGPISLNTASVEGGEQSGSCLTIGPVFQSVWFKWVAPVTANVTFDTEQSYDNWQHQPDTTITVWTGAALGALTEVACDDDSGAFLTSTTTFAATSGTTYWIQVGAAYEGVQGFIVLNWAQAGAGGDTYLHATYRIDGAAQGPYAINTKIGGIQLGSISSSQGMANHLIRNVKIGTSGYGSTEIWDEALTSGSVVPPFDSQTGGGDLSITGSGMQVLNATGNDAYGEKDFAASGDLYIQFQVNFDATEVSGGNDGFSIPLVVLDDALVWIDSIAGDFRSGSGNYLKWSADNAPGEFGGPIGDSTWYTVDAFYSTT